MGKLNMLNSRVFLFTFISCIVFMQSAFAYDYVFTNSKNWEDQFLSSVIAEKEDAEVLFFLSFSDFQVKIKTLPKDASILILESSSNPGIPSLRNQVVIQGFTDVSENVFNNYLDLQNEYFDYSSKVVLLRPVFSVEALSFVSEIVTNDYAPYFLGSTENDFSVAVNKLSSSSEIIAIGNFPFWQRDNILTLPSLTRSYFGLESEIVKQITSQLTSEKEWGIIVSPSAVDLNSIVQGNPVVVYLNDVSLLADVLQSSSIERYEVIGSGLVNSVTLAKQESGTDVRFLVKYARTVTGIEALQGQLLDMDTVPMPFPFSSLQVTSAISYPDSTILALTFENTGSVDVYFSTVFEFGTTIYSDNPLYMIRAGDTLSIPFSVTENSDSVSVNAQYGRSFPLANSLISADGLPLVTLPVTTSTESTLLTPEILSLEVNNFGKIFAKVKNPNPSDIQFAIQLYLNSSDSNISVDSLPLSSSSTVLLPLEERVIEIDASYVDVTSLRNTAVRSISHYGTNSLVFSIEGETMLAELKSGFMMYYIISAIVLLVAILAIVLLKRN